MSRILEFLPAARWEFDEAADWYNCQGSGLKSEFIRAVDLTISAILSEPFAFPIVYGSIFRRALVRRFPYSIIFVGKQDEIVDNAVFHTSRNPVIWRGRTE